MSFRFAAANDPVRHAGRRAAGRGLVARAERQAANDNQSVAAITFDPLLTDALRHFAAHGVGAVDAAVAAAAQAQACGDGHEKDRWLAITQMFDRRRAAAAGAALTPA